MPPRETLARARPLAALLLLLACAGETSAPPEADPASLRRAPAGDLVGSVGRYGSHVWRGVPFATPPLGELRWRAPQPAAPWPGVLQALEHGPLCPQLASRFAGDDSVPGGTPVGDEDCLTLDVYAPRLTPAQAGARGDLPVMVWLHGGGNTQGGARLYDGGNLAQRHSLVVVVAQYRLGPLGWFRHGSLRAQDESEEGRSGNFGTLDQIHLLEWVRDNARAFGGDPGNVTIFGESAGGRDVFALLLSPRARGLFHRAIVQSGGTETEPMRPAEAFADARNPGHRNSSGEVLLRLVQARDSVPRAEARARLDAMSPAEVARLLRGTPAPDLLRAYETGIVENSIEVPQLFRDGVVISAAEPLELAARAGGAAGVPVILGTNRDEFRVFLYGRPDFVAQVFGFLPWIRDERRYLVTAEHLSNHWKATGVDEPASRLQRAQGDTVFAYRFDWDEEPDLLLADASVLIGAAHGFEIPFVFGHWSLGRAVSILFTDGNRPGREELSGKMMSYWAEFAHSGAPGRGRGGDLPEWKPWDRRPGGSRFLRLDTEADGGIEMRSESVSRAGVMLAVDRDPRLPTQRDKCAVFYELARWRRGFGPEAYPEAGDRGCREFPFTEHPWP